MELDLRRSRIMFAMVLGENYLYLADGCSVILGCENSDKDARLYRRPMANF